MALFFRQIYYCNETNCTCLLCSSLRLRPVTLCVAAVAPTTSQAQGSVPHAALPSPLPRGQTSGEGPSPKHLSSPLISSRFPAILVFLLFQLAPPLRSDVR